MSDGQATDSRKQRSQTRYPGTVNAPKLEPQTRHKDMTLLQDLKNEIYRELNVETTAQVKELYPSYNLRRTSDWLELKAELVAKATDTQSEAPAKPYGFPESETVLTGKTGELTEAFPTTPGASTGETSEVDDLQPDLSEPEPFDGSAWADFVRRTNPKPTVIAEIVETDEEIGEVLTMPLVDPEAVADEVPESDAPMAPVPVALWDFMSGHNLTDVLSPWVHYLQWLDRLYTNASIVFESTFRSYQNA